MQKSSIQAECELFKQILLNYLNFEFAFSAGANHSISDIEGGDTSICVWIYKLICTKHERYILKNNKKFTQLLGHWARGTFIYFFLIFYLLCIYIYKMFVEHISIVPKNVYMRGFPSRCFLTHLQSHRYNENFSSQNLTMISSVIIHRSLACNLVSFFGSFYHRGTRNSLSLTQWFSRNCVVCWKKKKHLDIIEHILCSIMSFFFFLNEFAIG